MHTHAAGFSPRRRKKRAEELARHSAAFEAANAERRKTEEMRQKAALQKQQAEQAHCWAERFLVDWAACASERRISKAAIALQAHALGYDEDAVLQWLLQCPPRA